MPSRLDDVLRAGKAATTGPSVRWNGMAGRLTDILPSDKTNDPSSPGMQDALRVAGEIEAQQAELRERNRIAEQKKRQQHDEEVREAARKRELVKEMEAQIEKQEQQKQARIKEYKSGSDDMKWIILQAQLPLFTQMEVHLKAIEKKVGDEFDSLIGQDDTPSRAFKIMRLEDIFKELEELNVKLKMLQSGVEGAEPYDFYDPVRRSLF